MGKTLRSVFWQILWPAKMEILPHTVKEWKTGGNFNLDGPRAFAKRCQQVDAVFLFYFIFLPGHPKLLEVLINLFKASVLKTYGAKKKARKFESWLTSDHFVLHQLHELSFSCSLLLRANRNILESVRLLLWISTLLSCDQVSSCRTHRDKIYAT